MASAKRRPGHRLGDCWWLSIRGYLFCPFWTEARPAPIFMLIGLSVPVEVAFPGKPTATLRAGRYLHCSSAKGLGGIRARLARHMRAEKSIRWHVDLDQSRFSNRRVELPRWERMRSGADLSHLSFSIQGFGSTDCRMCQGHLLRWQDHAHQ
jgi:Uri superfamily endonuclease